MTNPTSRRLWTVMALGGVLLLALALAGNTDGTCTPLDPTPVCEADSDCGGVPPVDCEGAWECDGGACVWECGDPTLPPESCASDADCVAGEACVFDDATDCCRPDTPCYMYLPLCEGTCEPVAPPPYECRSDADCGPGAICVEEWDECPPPPGCLPGMDCPAVCGQPVVVGAHCEAVEPPPAGCVTDADCGPDEYCALPADCGWECPPGEFCPMWDLACVGTCMPVEPPPAECWSDADCGPGMRCDWGVEGQCCPPNAFCDASIPVCVGRCVPVAPPPFECWDDSDCGPGLMCRIDDRCYEECGQDSECAADRMRCGGHCVPIEPPPVECWDDADCGPGMRCMFHDNCGVPDCPDGAECDGAAFWNCGGVCEPVEPPPVECFGDGDCGPGMRCEIPDECRGECPEDMGCDWICVGVCVPDEPPAECWSNADCPAGMACEFLYDCAVPDCADDDCTEPFWGCPGVCVPVDPNPDYPYCESDADCRDGEYCEPVYRAYGEDGSAGMPCHDADGDGLCDDGWPTGICTPVEPPPQECWSDADCGPNEVCRMACAGGGACPPGADCEVPDPLCWGECVPVEPPPVECWSDYDCGPGMRCQIDDWCWDPNACDEDGNCHGGEPMWCGGVCVPVEETECWTDADCPAGMHCEPLDWYAEDGDPDAGFAPCRDANGDGVCDGDEYWPGGVCVPNDPPAGDCGADWECPADQRCQIDWGVCEAGCGSNMDCVPCVGRCVPIKECLDDADCPGGTICDYGDGGCLPWDCDHDNESDCIPPPCMGVCREPVFGAQA